MMGDAMGDLLPRRYMTWGGVRYRKVYWGDPSMFEYWAHGFNCLNGLVPDEFTWEAKATDWRKITKELPFNSEPGKSDDYSGLAILRSLKLRLIDDREEYGSTVGAGGVNFEVWIALDDVPVAKAAITELKRRFAAWLEAYEQTASR